MILPRSNRTENYRIHYSGHRPHVLEINYLQEGNLCEMYEGTEHVYDRGTIHTLVDNRNFTQYSTFPVLHEFFLYIALSAPAIPMTEEEVCRWVCHGNEAIVPEYVTDPGLCRLLGKHIKEQVQLSAEGSPLQPLQLIIVKGMTLERIGSMVGIPDATYLGRLFRRYTGMSVQQYRKNRGEM